VGLHRLTAQASGPVAVADRVAVETFSVVPVVEMDFSVEVVEDLALQTSVVAV